LALAAAAITPLSAPIDPARFTISDADIAALLNKLPLSADDADGGTGP
jgi:hypothetical protein